jgi:hypothetical protein
LPNTAAHSLPLSGPFVSALLSQRWNILRHVTASPSRIGSIARAALVLTLFEHKRLT